MTCGRPCDLLFDAIVLRVDELDGALRYFFERLKDYVTARSRDYEFTRKEVRQALRISKTQQHTYLTQLLELEYIRQVGGYANRGADLPHRPLGRRGRVAGAGSKLNYPPNWTT